MSTAADERVDWAALWQSGDLARLCFISLGTVFHAGCENMITTLMPAMVRDLDGVEFTGWTFAIYETGSIIAGAATGRLASYWTVRTNMIAAAIVFAFGCLATVMAPTMPWLLAGRLISGFGGGALISLSFVAVRRYFSDAIWPQLMAVLSVVWGISAFGGPLFGGLVDAFLTWRWAFIIFAAAALVFAAATRHVLRNEPVPDQAAQPNAPFPALALASLAAGVMAIAAAGVETRIPASLALLVLGFAGVALFFIRDARHPASRLFPSRPFDPRTTTGAGLIMVAALSVSTCSFGFYGPLLLAALHDFTPLQIGLIICSESIAWSVLSILVANAPRRLEPLIMTGGALMIASGIAGFAYAVPSGSVPVILFCALLQGGGFGILWPFASRRIISAAPEKERDIAASAFSTLQRMGYAIGAALAGMIANANGFSGGFTREAAQGASVIIFVAFLPLAAIGCLAAWRLSQPQLR
ncbi:MAG: MFS transporter [Parvibaculaceae bacterium]